MTGIPLGRELRYYYLFRFILHCETHVQCNDITCSKSLSMQDERQQAS